MTKLRLYFLIFISFILSGTSAMAMEFQHIGYEALSMGGAGVASSSGSFAAYYNPALLPEHRHQVDVSFSVLYRHREINISDHIDNLSDIDIQETIDEVIASGGTLPADSITRRNVATIKSELTALTGKNGLQLMPGISLGVQTGNFGFGAYMVSGATASAVVDEDHLDFIYEEGGLYVAYDEVTNNFSASTLAEYEASSLEYAIDNGLTYVKLDGLAYVEIPIAYGHQFKTPLGNINLGGSFKIMPGYTFEYALDIDTDSGDIEDELEDAYESDTGFGVDLGCLYKPVMMDNLSLGLVAKNINTPEFETKSGRTLEVKPQVRAGIAFDLSDKVTLAFDADMTNNETFIPGYNSQYFGGGINVHPASWLSLRGGLAKNIQESDEGTLLTGGVGIGTKWIQFDIAGQYGTESGSLDGEEVPRIAGFELSLVSKWN